MRLADRNRFGRDADRGALLREAAMVAAGARDVRLSDNDRESIAQCHRAVLDVLHARPGDHLTTS